MIDKVEIVINEGLSNEELIMINNQSKKAFVNGEVKEIPNDFVDRLIEIVKYWKKEYGSSNQFETTEYTISLFEGNIEETYHGKGIFPSNYNELKELLGELRDWVN